MPEQKKSADEGEYPNNYAEGHAGEKNRVADVAFGVGEEVVEQVPESESSEQNGQAGDDVQHSHGNASLTQNERTPQVPGWTGRT